MSYIGEIRPQALEDAWESSAWPDGIASASRYYAYAGNDPVNNVDSTGLAAAQVASYGYNLVVNHPVTTGAIVAGAGVVGTAAAVIFSGGADAALAPEEIAASIQAGEETTAELTAAAGRAAETVGSGSGPVYGTQVHSAFESEVNALGNPGYANFANNFAAMNNINVSPAGVVAGQALGTVVGSGASFVPLENESPKLK